MNPLRRLALWWINAEWIPMPSVWAPHVLGFALGSRARRVHKPRPKFPLWQRVVRRWIFHTDRRLLDCVACRQEEATGPDLLCDLCWDDPEIREDYAD